MRHFSLLLSLSLCLISCKNAGVPDNVNTILVGNGDGFQSRDSEIEAF